jgi:hypothetical protein
MNIVLKSAPIPQFAVEFTARKWLCLAAGLFLPIVARRHGLA